MTERAKRLAEFLEEKGWTVFEEKYVCHKCSLSTGYGKFCYRCGSPLKRDRKNERDVIGEIESAIKFALKNKK